MRILSDFSDYYDNVQSLGHDNTLTYSRFSKTVELKEQKDKLEIREMITKDMPKSKEHDDKNQLTRAIVGVCGKLYLAFRQGLNPEFHTPRNKYYYDTDSLKKDFPNLGAYNKYSAYFYSYPDFPQLGEFKSGADELFIRLNTPAFVITNLANKLSYQNVELMNKGDIQTDPNLGALEFFKVTDNYQMYQELEMYLGNTLVTRDEPSEMTDKQKVGSHGFDLKYGFRTRPKDKK